MVGLHAPLPVREAVRGFRSGRLATGAALLVLTLAMGAATTTYSVVYAVAWRPLPFEQPDRLVAIAGSAVNPTWVRPLTPAAYISLAEQTRAFSAIAAARMTASLRLDVNGTTETVTVRRVTANLFDTLGVRPAAGRWFGPTNQQAGGDDVAVLSHDLWTRAFGADRAVIGRSVTLGERTRRVVAVLPADVWFPVELNAVDVYVPDVFTAADRENTRAATLSVVGRMRPGISVAQARADVVRVSNVPTTVRSLHEHIAGRATRWLLLALATVGFILLTACVNVATLLSVRAAARAPEFATRLALGASRRQLAASLLTEGLILSLAAVAGAILLSWWGVNVAKTHIPPDLITRRSTIALDAHVLSVSIITAIVCAVGFASAPAWQTIRTDLYAQMQERGFIIGNRRIERTLTTFLIVEMTSVSALMVVTTLIVRSFIAVTTADLGFDRHNVIGIGYERPFTDAPNASRPAAIAMFRAALLDRTRTVPGVTGAALSTNGQLPMSGGHVLYSIEIPGTGVKLNEDALETRAVTPDYFHVMQMRLTRGRLFDVTDRFGAPPVILINDVAARRFFPGRDPVGQIVIFRGPTTIVGVLRAVNFDGPEIEPRPELYIPADQERLPMPLDAGTLVVRTNGNMREVGTTVREAIRPVLGREAGVVQLVDDSFRDRTAGRRFNASLMAVLGVVALVLAAAGVYGTMAFFVVRQTRATGLRLALGASPRRILIDVLKGALGRVAVGAAAGLGGAWATSSLIRSFLFGIQPTDPYVYLEVIATTVIVAAVAALIPASRAARIDPVVALRCE